MVIVFLIVFFITYFAAIFGICALAYIVQGLVVLKLSKKMGVPCSWQAFVPIFAEYRLGKLAEEACRLEKPEKKPFRFGTLLAGGYGASYGMCAVTVLGSVLAVVVIGVCTVLMGVMETAGQEYADVTAILALALLFVYLVYMSAISLLSSLYNLLVYATLALNYVVLYKIYKAFAKDNAVVLLLLSVFVPFASMVIGLVLAYGEKYQIEAREQEGDAGCFAESESGAQSE